MNLDFAEVLMLQKPKFLEMCYTSHNYFLRHTAHILITLVSMTFHLFNQEVENIEIIKLDGKHNAE